jgi:hypothetical protein
LLEEEEKGAGRMVLQQSVTISMTILIGRLRKIEDEKESDRGGSLQSFNFRSKKMLFSFFI